MNGVGKVMGGFASFWIALIGLGLIFTAGPIVGCLTLAVLFGTRTYLEVTERTRDAVDEVRRLRDVLEEIEEGIEIPPEATGDPVDYYRAHARVALRQDGKVVLESPSDDGQEDIVYGLTEERPRR